MTRPPISTQRFVCAILIGTLAAIALPAYSAISANFSDPPLLANGMSDDGYVLSMFMAMVLLPFIFVFAAICKAIIFLLLISVDFFRWWAVAGVSMALSATVLTAKGIPLVTMLLVTGLFTSGAMIAWWICERRGPAAAMRSP